MNGLITFLASLVRHVLTIAAYKVAEAANIAQADADSAVTFLVPVVVAFLTWIVTKYGTLLLQKIGFITCITFFAAGLLAVGTTSCTATFNPLTGEVQFGVDPSKAAEAAKRGNALAERKLEDLELPSLPPVIEATK